MPGHVLRRPIEDHERPHLVALGARLRQLRLDAGLSQDAMASAAQLSRSQVSVIEAGESRTRRSTLQRLLAAVGRLDILDECVAIADVALADESQYAERIARRRERRWAAA